jgi:hypothetical protein
MSTHITVNTLGKTDPDPVTGEPGRHRGGPADAPEPDMSANVSDADSHPVATGVGAVGIGAAGVAVGAMAGPIGAVIGGVLGAVAGGIGGSAVGESISAGSEDDFWRGQHARQAYATPSDDYEDFRPAYRVGYEGYSSLGSSERTFEECEAILRRNYEGTSPAPRLSWEKTRPAAQAAWHRLIREQNAGPNLDIPPDPIMATAPQAAEVPMSTPSRRS